MNWQFALIVFLISMIASADNNIKIKLFVSASMGEALLEGLLKQAENEALVVRGINARQQNLASSRPKT